MCNNQWIVFKNMLGSKYHMVDKISYIVIGKAYGRLSYINVQSLVGTIRIR